MNQTNACAKCSAFAAYAEAGARDSCRGEREHDGHHVLGTESPATASRGGDDARRRGARTPRLDISDYDEVTRFAADIHANHPAMDVVMNIAGVSAWGTVDRLTHDHWKSMVDINLMGPIHVIEAFVPPMVEARRGGHLVNVSSAAGLVALPWHAPTAQGVRPGGLSEVLRFDLARHRIGVSVVVPGAVKTPLVQTVQIAGWTARIQACRSGRAIHRTCGLAGHVADRILRGRRQEQVLDLHLTRHTRALHVQARGVVAIQRGDAAGQRGVQPCAAARRAIAASVFPSPTAGP